VFTQYCPGLSRCPHHLRIGKSLIYLGFLAALLHGGGCKQLNEKARLAGTDEIQCTLELGSRRHGELPHVFRVKYVNNSANTAVFPLPRPYVKESDEMPSFPFLVFHLATERGTSDFTFTNVNAHRLPAPEFVRLRNGEGVCRDYDTSDLYRFGPDGPDLGGSFADYFKKGDVDVEIHAVVVFGMRNGTLLSTESKPIILKCSFQEWLFQVGE